MSVEVTERAPAVLLYAPQDFRNLCLMARTLEAFGHRECFVFDPHRLVRECYGKARRRELRAVSGGAFEKIAWLRLDEPAAFVGAYRGRVVATVAEASATPLSAYRFEASDLILFGSESTGLPDEVLRASDAHLTIPLSGVTGSLNLAVSAGIVLFERERQLGLLGPH